MKTITGFYAAAILLCIAGLYGWINNIITICNYDFGGEITGMIVVRIVGIAVAPIGAIIGYF